MPQLPRKRKKSKSAVQSPRKRVRHITPRRLGEIFDKGEDEVNKLSQELQENVKEVLNVELSKRESLNLLRSADLDINNATELYLSQRQEEQEEEPAKENPEAQEEDSDASLEDKVIEQDEDDEKEAEAVPEEPLEAPETFEDENDPLEDPIEMPEDIEEEVEEAGEEEEEEVNDAKERNLTHYLSARFTQNALPVFKSCVLVCSKIQDTKDAIVMKIDSREKKIKFWCRSSGDKSDVLEFVFENNANPRCFRDFKFSSDADRTTDPDFFELAVPLKNLQTIGKKIDVKKHILTMDFHIDADPTKSLVRFKFDDISDSTRFDFTLKKINIEAVDPMLSQFHSVQESQDPAASELNKSVQEDDALVTLWTSTKKFKEAHSMFSGISDVISFQIHRLRPDSSELSEGDDDDEKFEVRLKSKGSEGDIVSKTKLPLRGGPKLQSIRVKKGQQIKKNINVDLPTDMVGKILNLKFIHNTVKIDFYEVDKVRFIFKFSLSKCQGRLYYNVEPHPDYKDEEELLQESLEEASANPDADLDEDEIDLDPLAGSSSKKSPRRRARKRLRHSLSARIDKPDSDDEL